MLAPAAAQASSVQSLSAVTLSSSAGGIQHVRYSFSFVTSPTGGLGSGGTITVAAPAGTVLPSVAQLHDDSTNTTISRSGTLTNGNATLTINLCCTDTINAGDMVTVTLSDVKNAAAGGHTIDVSTSADTSPATTPSYTLVAPQQVSGVTPVSLT